MKKILCIIIMVIMVLGVSNIVLGSGESKQKYYAQVTIKKGDTIWNLAEEFNNKNMSTKEYVDFIMKFNGLKSDKIYAGDKIIIPYFK